MMLVQFSAAQGPAECCLALDKAFKQFTQEAQALALKWQVLERQDEKHRQLPRSLLVSVQGAQLAILLARWQGTLLWIAQSPFRAKHKRKNWFIGIEHFAPRPVPAASEIEIRTCRASGAGGQHVNTTDSAVQVTHLSTGISVRMESERSQHANKKLALLVLAQKLEQQQHNQAAADKADRRLVHHQLARGDARLVFKGMDFQPA